jgi:hypothetical protein
MDLFTLRYEVSESYSWLKIYGRVSAWFGYLLLVVFVLGLLLYGPVPSISSPIDVIDEIPYKGYEEWKIKLLYIFFFIALILHGNFIGWMIAKKKFSKVSTFSIVNTSVGALVVASVLARGYYVRFMFLNALTTWMNLIYGDDNYLFPDNKAFDDHPPGMYILKNFYTQGSEFILAPINMRISSKEEL